MQKKTKLLLLGAAVFATILLLWSIYHTSEPRYHGQPLSYWVARGRAESAPDETKAALQAMAGDAVPYLIAQLQWQPSMFKSKLRALLPKRLADLQFFQDRNDPRQDAALALGKFRGAAAAAIPQLEVFSKLNAQGQNSWLKIAAQAALIQIKKEPLDPYINELKDESNPSEWYLRAMMIGHLGTDAVAAVPILVECLGTNHDLIVQNHALVALGMIRMRPDLCVKPIAELIKPANDGLLRGNASAVLGAFGLAVKPLWNDLRSYLEDSDRSVRSNITNLLKRLDAKAALELGIK